MTRRQGGFTLLEILVAVMVLSVLAALVYGMLRLGMRSWEAATTRIEASELTRIGWTFVQSSLNDARSVPSRHEDDPGIHFFGAHDALEFVAELPAHLAPGGLYALRLYLDSGAGQGPARLQVEAVHFADYENRVQDEELPRAVLAEDVAALELAYYGASADSAESGWTDTWSGRETLPLLVRMQVALRDGTQWPVLIAHPRYGSAEQLEQGAAEAEWDPSQEQPDVP
jgi:general secretion pathway protein J